MVFGSVEFFPYFFLFIYLFFIYLFFIFYFFLGGGGAGDKTALVNLFGLPNVLILIVSGLFVYSIWFLGRISVLIVSAPDNCLVFLAHLSRRLTESL